MKYLDIINDLSNPLYDQKAPIVVLCFDNNYFHPAVNTMNSINEYNPSVAFVCLCSFLTDDNIAELLENKKYGVRYMQIKWTKNINTRFYSIDVAFNAYIPWILPEIDKCLYVDPDVICCKNFEKIFDSKAMVAMSLELSGIVNNLASKLPNAKDEDVAYYNTGTLFLNLKALREKYTEEDINSNFIDKINQYHLLDQDFFNSYFKKDIITLPITWNVQWYEFYGSRFYKKLISEAVFIHFSFHKPWRHTSPFKQSALYLKLSSDKKTIKLVKKARRKRLAIKVVHFFSFPFRQMRKLFKNEKTNY